MGGGTSMGGVTPMGGCDTHPREPRRVHAPDPIGAPCGLLLALVGADLLSPDRLPGGLSSVLTVPGVVVFWKTMPGQQHPPAPDMLRAGPAGPVAPPPPG